MWVSLPSSGLDKRQATLQLCIRAEGEQNVKPAIVFRGKGNMRADEKAEYDEGVDGYFQSCEWMDSEINMHAVGSKNTCPRCWKVCRIESDFCRQFNIPAG